MKPLRGINLPYFFDAYGYDLAPNALSGMGPREVDPMRIYAQLLRACEMGFKAVRIWLCESAEGILMEAGIVSGVHPVLVESIAIIQECASLCGLKLYWTLLDAHSWKHSRDHISKGVLSVRDDAARFAERVAAPIVRRLDPRLTLAVEIVNEPEVLIGEADTSPGLSPLEWEAVGAAIKTIADAIRSEHGGTIVTAGTHYSELARLWRSGPGLTAIDVHQDAADLPLPSRAELISAVPFGEDRVASMPLIAGCCYDAKASIQTYDGYDAIFLWRLEEAASFS